MITLSANVNGRACAIVPEPDAEGFRLYTLDVSGLADALVATDPTPTKLSALAFLNGAISVRHDYDLRAWAEWASQNN